VEGGEVPAGCGERAGFVYIIDRWRYALPEVLGACKCPLLLNSALIYICIAAAFHTRPNRLYQCCDGMIRMPLVTSKGDGTGSPEPVRRRPCMPSSLTMQSR
jgi:hypothetical protein